MIAEPIRESGIIFGSLEEERLFKIEHSDVHQKAGAGIKSVEFIYLSPQENLLFVEAKSSCPNAENKEESEEKKRRYEEFFSDVTDKFIDSINMFAATILGRNNDVSCMGENMCNRTYTKVGFKLVLIISNAKESWLSGPKAELGRRLLRFRKIWKADVFVLNKDMAKNLGIVIEE